MEITLPIVIVSLLFYQAYLYGKAVYMRRMVMMKRVTMFLERTDASDQLKMLAATAFVDSLSLKLPFQLVSFRKKRQDNDPGAKRAERRAKENLRKDRSSLHARQELDSLIEMMFTINLSFNKPLVILASLPHFRVERKPVPKDFYAESFQHGHMKIKEMC